MMRSAAGTVAGFEKKLKKVKMKNLTVKKSIRFDDLWCEEKFENEEKSPASHLRAPLRRYIMPSSSGGFETPGPRYRSPEEVRRDNECVARSGSVIHDRDEKDHEPNLRDCISNFLWRIEGRDSGGSNMEDMLLRFIITCGTVHTDGGNIMLEQPRMKEDIGRLQFSRGSFFVQSGTNLYGLIRSGVFHPIMEVFDIFHRREVCKPRSAEGIEYYSRVLTEPDHWNANERFATGPFGGKTCISVEQLSNYWRFRIYDEYGLKRILNEQWLIFERFVYKLNEPGSEVRVPLFFSETGRRYNYCIESSRRALREYLSSNYTDITKDCWKRMLESAPVCNPLVYFWRGQSLRRLISIDTFSDLTFNASVDEITLACPIIPREPLLFGNMDIINPRRNKGCGNSGAVRLTDQPGNVHPRDRKPVLSSGIHSKVTALNQLFNDSEFLNTKPTFHQDLDQSQHESNMRSIMIETINQLKDLHPRYEEYDETNLLANLRKIIEDLFDTENDEDIFDEYMWSNEDLLKGLYNNLNFYMCLLPRIAWKMKPAEAFVRYKILKKLNFGYDYY